MVYIPILGAFFEAAGILANKKLAVRKGIGYGEYLVYGFLAIVIVMLPFVYFTWYVDDLAERNMNVAIFVLIISFSFFANYLNFFALKHKDLSKLESVRLTLPLFTILLTFLFSFFFSIYRNERNYYILFFAFVAILALFFANIKKEHFYFDKYSVAALFSSIFFAIELTISKSLLNFYDPISFYFIRCFLIFILSLMVFRNKLNKINNGSIFLFLISGVFWVGYRILLYYGYNIFGIVFTTTIFILSPVLVYVFSAIFLKEKISRRQVFSSVIIVFCILGALLFETKSL
ncbi:MAG: DMT family transporter [Nanoarchaeota archaeon]